MSKNFDKLNKYLQKAAAYTSVLNLIDYDSNVNAPADSDMYTSKVTGIISNDCLLYTSPSPRDCS